MSCIFCDIVSGHIPSYLIYEDEYTYAFLDIAQDAYGHTLVIPKKHVTNILDCDRKTLGHVMNTVKLISEHYVDDLGFTGVNVLNASGVSAEQTVMHLHFHIIPRRDSDDFKVFPHLNGTKESLEQMQKTLKVNK